MPAPDMVVRIVDEDGNPDQTVAVIDGISGLSPSVGDLLVWNGSAWVDRALVDADIPSTIARDAETTAAVAAEAALRSAADSSEATARAAADLLRVTVDADPGYVGTPIGWPRGAASLVAANRCDYYEVPPAMKDRALTTTRFYVSTAAVVNLCIALYEHDGVSTWNRLVTTGSFACPGTTGLKSQALAAGATVTAGRRLAVGLSADGTGAGFYALDGFQLAFFEPAGVRFGGNKTTGQFPLPATIPALDAGAGRGFAVMFT